MVGLFLRLSLRHEQLRQHPGNDRCPTQHKTCNPQRQKDPGPTDQPTIIPGQLGPTHGYTEPWRFVVYSADAVQQFCHQHAEMYKDNTPPEKFNPAKYQKQQHNGDKTSHIIAVYMQRGNNPNITALEETCATAAAVQNILLGAEALGISILWSTGGAVLQPAMKDYLGLDEEDRMIGLLYMGYTDEPASPGRRTPIEAKTKWINNITKS
jgi:nitroreductase